MKYVGSKNRIAKYIVPIIQWFYDNYCLPDAVYAEPFVGGANVITKIKSNHRYGVNNNKYLIALLNKMTNNVKMGIDDVPDTISRQEYENVKNNKDEYEDWYVGLVGFCATYNGKFFGSYANNVKTKIGTIRNYTDEAIRNLKKQSFDFFDKSTYKRDRKSVV